MTTTILSAKLRGHGLSCTKQRQLVFDILQEQGAMSMAELTSLCHGQADRASIYRTIQLFEKLNFVRRVNIGWKYKLELSDVFNGHHHHITCNSCGRLQDLQDDSRLQSILAAMVEQTGFSIVGHDLEVAGICKTCQVKAVV